MARQYRLGFWRRIVNLLVRALLRYGVGPSHTYLLAVVGKQSRVLYSTPVRLVEKDGARWLIAPYGAVGWVRHARKTGRVVLSRGRKSEIVKIVELPPERAAPVLKSYVAQVSVTRPFFDVTPQSPLEDFIAEAPRHPVFHVL